MEIGELVSLLLEALLDPERQDEYCKGEKSEAGTWKSKINKWGTEQNCSGTQLYINMEDHHNKKKKDPRYLGPPTPFVEKPEKGSKLGLSDCGDDCFPVQAHHLIPKNHLPGHGVCAFLAKKYKGEGEFKLAGDTYYDTDHPNNGYCMPYAYALKDWELAKNNKKKEDLAYMLMDKAKRQLHQGSHKVGPYEEPPDDEEPNIHNQDPGYLDTVDDLLDVVQLGASIHAVICNICQSKENKKMIIQPLAATVRHVNQVSGLVKLLVDANRIFISKLAAWHWGKKKKKIKIPDFLK